MEFGHLLEHHGYTFSFFGALIEGEIVVVLAGLASHRGYLSLPLVIAFGALGGFLQGEICFLVGRRYGGKFFERFPSAKPAYTRVEALLQRRGPVAIGAVRVLYGLRIVGPIAIGMGQVSAATFALANAVASLLWATAWAGAGYVAGEALTRFFADMKHLERPLFLIVAAGALVVIAIVRWRRHERQKKPLPPPRPRRTASR